MSKKFRLIPSVLYKENSVVKSVQYANHRVVGDLSSTMRVFSRRQADELIIYDLDASRKLAINWEMIEVCVSNSNMPLTYGGGVAETQTALKLIESGFDKISLNSALYENPNTVYEIAKNIGSSSTVASIDLKRNGSDVYICKNRGTEMLRKFDLGSEVNFLENIGVGEIIVNCIDNDGLMGGYDFANLDVRAINHQIPMLISGGCSGSDCIRKAFDHGFDGAVMSSIFLWKGDSVPSLKSELRNQIPVREVI